METLRLLVIGCGSIGVTLARSMERLEHIDRVYIFDKSRECSNKLAKAMKKVVIAEDIEKVIEEVDFAVEAASQEALKQYGPKVLAKGKPLLILSVGALADDDFRASLERLAKETGARIHVPSGAVAAIDGIRAASKGPIEEIILISYKPPSAFKGNEYVMRQGMDLEGLDKPLILFSGNARDACRYFPQNVNVAATISIAGIGFEKTKVKIVVDPHATRNIHRIIVKGEFGELECKCRNLPFPRNPRTSYIAALSAIASLERMVGTSPWIV